MFGYKSCRKKDWRDLTNNHIYHENDKYPFNNEEVPADRLKELSTKKNKIGEILIVERNIEDLNIEELKIVADNEKIAYDETVNQEQLIEIINTSLTEKKDLKKQLTKNKISFNEDDSIETLRELLNDSNK